MSLAKSPGQLSRGFGRISPASEPAGCRNPLIFIEFHRFVDFIVFIKALQGGGKFSNYFAKMDSIGFRSEINLFVKGWRRMENGERFYIRRKDIVQHLPEYWSAGG